MSDFIDTSTQTANSKRKQFATASSPPKSIVADVTVADGIAAAHIEISDPNVCVKRRQLAASCSVREGMITNSIDVSPDVSTAEVSQSDVRRKHKQPSRNVSALGNNYSFSGSRRPCRQRDVCGDFVNLKISRPSLSEVLIGVGCACVCS